MFVYKVSPKPNSISHNRYIQEKYLEYSQVLKKKYKLIEDAWFKLLFSFFVLSARSRDSQIFLQCVIYGI